MSRLVTSTRIGLVVLMGLLTLPIAQVAPPVEAKPRARIVTRAYNNTTVINLPTAARTTPESADLYPSAIRVDAPKRAKIRDVNLILNDLGHTFPDDVQMVLVAPSGRTAIVMANVGGSGDAEDVTLTLDDEATTSLPTADNATLQSGAYRPTNDLGSIDFNEPGPNANANAALSVFDGGNPNGTWRLFVMDGSPQVDPGAFAGGWGIQIEMKVKAKKKR